MAITASSCTKDENDKAEPGAPIAEGTAIIAGTKSCVMSKLIYDGGDYETVEYDAKNRPVKINYFDSGKAEGYAKLTYTATEVVMEYYDDKNVKEETYNFKLGSNGYIAGSSNVSSYTNGNYLVTITSTSTSTHNGDGYLIKEEYSSVTSSNQPGHVNTTDKSSSTYTYTNGNLTSVKYEGNGSISTSTFEYDADKVNNLPVSDDEIITFLIGKKNKNLLKKETHTSGGGSDISNYTYTFSADGLVNKKTRVSVSKQTGAADQTYTDSYQFEYSCK
jgi:hypothetical protein